jgi:hypothetical protein
MDLVEFLPDSDLMTDSDVDHCPDPFPAMAESAWRQNPFSE